MGETKHPRADRNPESCGHSSWATLSNENGRTFEPVLCARLGGRPSRTRRRLYSHSSKLGTFADLLQLHSGLPRAIDDVGGSASKNDGPELLATRYLGRGSRESLFPSRSGNRSLRKILSRLESNHDNPVVPCRARIDRATRNDHDRGLDRDDLEKDGLLINTPPQSTDHTHA